MCLVYENEMSISQRYPLQTSCETLLTREGMLSMPREIAPVIMVLGGPLRSQCILILDVYTRCCVIYYNFPGIGQKSAQRPPQCGGDCPCALIVSALRVRLSQDRLRVVLESRTVRVSKRHPMLHKIACQAKICYFHR